MVIVKWCLQIHGFKRQDSLTSKFIERAYEPDSAIFKLEAIWLFEIGPRETTAAFTSCHVKIPLRHLCVPMTLSVHSYQVCCYALPSRAFTIWSPCVQPLCAVHEAALTSRNKPPTTKALPVLLLQGTCTETHRQKPCSDCYCYYP